MAIGRSRKTAKFIEDPALSDGYKFVPAEMVFLL
jgi:hypothetical protein